MVTHTVQGYIMGFFGKTNSQKIRIYGDPVLKMEAAKVENIDDAISKLADSMIKTMRGADGVGLAAPQIGKSIRLIVLEVPYESENMQPSSPGELQLLPQMPLALVNPVVTPTTAVTTTAEEGCLSVPKIYAKVTRPESLLLEAELLTGRKIRVECGGFLARALQHELDHLNGILFVERVDEEEAERISESLNALKKSSLN